MFIRLEVNIICISSTSPGQISTLLFISLKVNILFQGILLVEAEVSLVQQRSIRCCPVPYNRLVSARLDRLLLVSIYN